MPRDRPDPATLLEQARNSLLRHVLPGLEGDARYEALMIASSMAIAAREFADGAGIAAEDAAAWRAFCGVAGEAPLDDLIRDLAREIRAGRRDADPAAHRLLTDSTRRRLRIANPKLLRAEGLE